MKRPLKITLLSLSGLAIIGAFFWMRSLASWRPQKIGVLPKPYAPQHISSDGRFVMAMDMISTVSYDFKTFDLTTAKSYDWPVTNVVGDMSVPAFGWAEPFYWFLKSSETGQPQSIELQDPLTRQTRHSLPWKNRDYSSFMAVRVSGHKAYILSPRFFREFDLNNDKMTRQVKLEYFFASDSYKDDSIQRRYAISADGKTLYGSWFWQGGVWDAHAGKLRTEWILSAPKNSVPADPDFFSPNGNILVCRRNTLWSFVDSTTGKIRWTTNIAVTLSRCFSEEGSEVVVPQKNNCDVRDVASGRILRSLPGPTVSAPDVIRVTSDWIYTTNLQGEICRWRAR